VRNERLDELQAAPDLRDRHLPAALALFQQAQGQAQKFNSPTHRCVAPRSDRRPPDGRQAARFGASALTCDRNLSS
jgi:hypothetical protein